MARHADIVLPSTTALERDDTPGSRNDPLLIAMPALAEPYAQSRDDYGRSPRWPTGWASASSSPRAAPRGSGSRTSTTSGPPDWISRCPTFDEFWADGPTAAADRGRADAARRLPRRPGGAPLATPSGRIEIFSADIDGFGYDDCPGHPTWLEPDGVARRARAPRFPLHLLANQPATRLHSQLDGGATSQALESAGREPIRMHPDEPRAAGSPTATSCGCSTTAAPAWPGVVVDDAPAARRGAAVDRRLVRPGGPGRSRTRCACTAIPNVLTADVGTSSLAQGCTGAHVLVAGREVRRPAAAGAGA